MRWSKRTAGLWCLSIFDFMGTEATTRLGRRAEVARAIAYPESTWELAPAWVRRVSAAASKLATDPCRMKSAMRSPMTMAVTLVLARMQSGIIDASATRSPSSPYGDPAVLNEPCQRQTMGEHHRDFGIPLDPPSKGGQLLYIGSPARRHRGDEPEHGYPHASDVVPEGIEDRVVNRLGAIVLEQVAGLKSQPMEAQAR